MDALDFIRDIRIRVQLDLLQVCLLCKVFGFGKFLGSGSFWEVIEQGARKCGRVKIKADFTHPHFRAPCSITSQKLPKPKNFPNPKTLHKRQTWSKSRVQSKCIR